ncbi:MAG: hypothetical protein Ct9H300mP24_3910 [Candidatus Neomarinimicrobiota bacterium]|nr:MAG: hypothetical protein Ct9H300mP24_3910 [Candidatus Neomarinimicrobiota bacterium]
MIYTSGTTGVPKGVMLTHDNVCRNLLSIGELIELIETKFNREEKVFLSFLPVAHSFERVGDITVVLMQECKFIMHKVWKP